MLLFVYTTTHKRFEIFTCRYFKLSWNTTALRQSDCRNFSCSSIRCLKEFFVSFFFFDRSLPWALLTSILMRHCQHCVSVRWPSLSSHRAILVSNEFSKYAHNTIAQPEPFTICKPFPRVFSYAFPDAWEKPGKDVDAIHTDFPPTRPCWKYSCTAVLEADASDWKPPF